jgi:hypothetical protein
MTKLTPKDVLGNGLIKGDFRKAEAERLGSLTQHPRNALVPIDAKTFSEYFCKCTGSLNSVLKKGDEVKEGALQQVVKNQIGFIGKINYTKSKGKNAKYADQSTAFSVLHPAHVKLVCKKDKRKMVKEFMDIKSDIILKFHQLKVLARDYIEDHITVSEAFEVSHKLPTHGTHSYVNSGYMLLNGRSVPKEHVFVAVNDNTDFFGDYKQGVTDSHSSYYAPKSLGCITVTIFIKEPRPKSNIFHEDVFDTTTLVRFSVHGSHHIPLKTDVNVYDSQFEGVDVNGMAQALVPAYIALRDDMNVQLEEIKETYLGEFLLSEICDSDNSAI